MSLKSQFRKTTRPLCPGFAFLTPEGTKRAHDEGPGRECKTQTQAGSAKAPGPRGALTGLLRTMRHWSKWWCSSVEWQYSWASGCSLLTARGAEGGGRGKGESHRRHHVPVYPFLWLTKKEAYFTKFIRPTIFSPFAEKAVSNLWGGSRKSQVGHCNCCRLRV